MPPKFEAYNYKSDVPGPHLLVLGAINGDEICGTIAASRLRTELELDIFTAGQGKTNFSTGLQSQAYKAGKRFISSNLNRIIACKPSK